MNKALLEAYLNLTEALLSSPNGEELQILAANQDLLGIGLGQTMLQVADALLEKGDSDKANRLINISDQLLGVDGHNKTLGIARSQSPTQPNQTSPPSKELLINTIQKNTSSNTPSDSQQ